MYQKNLLNAQRRKCDFFFDTKHGILLKICISVLLEKQNPVFCDWDSNVIADGEWICSNNMLHCWCEVAVCHGDHDDNFVGEIGVASSSPRRDLRG